MGNSASARRPPVPDKWDVKHIPSLAGKVAIVTGANSGIGYETALELARRGADVVLACRSELRGRQAEVDLRELLASTPTAGSVKSLPLDVSSLASVRAFSEHFLATHKQLDILVNNAGIMAGPFALSADGVESQFATNHLGHFALTGQLLPMLKLSPDARVINVSSLVHRHAWLFNVDTVGKANSRRYHRYLAYADSKLCNLLFTLELNRRLKASGVLNVTAVACHPGSTATSLVANAVNSNQQGGSSVWSWLFRLAGHTPIFQTQHMGALPTLYAATAADVRGGDFYGPKGFMAAWGYPTLETPSRKARSKSSAAKLWVNSETMAGGPFNV